VSHVTIYECDCGSGYSSSAAVLQCASTNHGRGWEGMENLTSIQEFEEWVVQAWTAPDDLNSLFVMTTGLAGETGEVQEVLLRDMLHTSALAMHLGVHVGKVVEPIKKQVRNGMYIDPAELAGELGDVLYYLVRIARKYGLTMAQVMEANRSKVNARKRAGKGPAGKA
jgi:NTP pyrophosphatase (non-canonical NTP hydrolase)